MAGELRERQLQAIEMIRHMGIELNLARRRVVILELNVVSANQKIARLEAERDSYLRAIEDYESTEALLRRQLADNNS